MKKIILLALMITLASVKGYCQLMQSNSVGASGKTSVIDTIRLLKKVVSRTDSVNIFPAFKENRLLLKLVDDSRAAYAAYAAQNDEIVRLESFPGKRNVADQKKINELKKDSAKMSEELKELKQKISTYLNDSDKLHDQINALTIENYQNFLSVLDKDLDSYDKQIAKNNDNALARFDTLIRLSKGNIENNAGLFKEVVIKGVQIKRDLDLLKAERDKFYKSYLELSRIQEDLVRYSGLKETIYTTMVKTQQELGVSQGKLIAGNQAFILAYNEYVEYFNKYAEKINDQIAKVNKDEESSAKYASALGGINKVFGDQGSLVPNISVVGQKKFSNSESGSFYGEVKLFIGGNDDNKTNTGTNNLFIPEASTFGFMTDFSFGFISAHQNARKSSLTGHYEQRLGINIGAYYLGKKLQPDTLTRFNTNLFHVKIGVQYILIPHVLSAYINTNSMLVATNVSQVEKYYTGVSKVRMFTSFGIESYLDLNDVKDFHLLINLGFVSINDDVKAWVKNSDSVIPNVKLSLVKTFNW